MILIYNTKKAITVNVLLEQLNRINAKKEIYFTLE